MIRLIYGVPTMYTRKTWNLTYLIMMYRSYCPASRTTRDVVGSISSRRRKRRMDVEPTLNRVSCLLCIWKWIGTCALPMCYCYTDLLRDTFNVRIHAWLLHGILWIWLISSFYLKSIYTNEMFLYYYYFYYHYYYYYYHYLLFLLFWWWWKHKDNHILNAIYIVVKVEVNIRGGTNKS